jgi:CcmD family protein
MSPLLYVGAAYAAVWVLLFLYVWRLTSMSRKLADRVAELEREVGDRSRR